MAQWWERKRAPKHIHGNSTSRQASVLYTKIFVGLVIGFATIIFLNFEFLFTDSSAQISNAVSLPEAEILQASVKPIIPVPPQVSEEKANVQNSISQKQLRHTDESEHSSSEDSSLEPASREYPNAVTVDEKIQLKAEAEERKKMLKASSGRRIRADCDVPCAVQSYGGIVGKYSVFDEENIATTFMSTMEGPRHYPQTLHKNGAHGLSTTSFQSDIIMPYFSWAEYDIKMPAIHPENVIQGASFAARNCHSLNNRELLVRTLQKHIRVDAVSDCLHNAPWPAGISRQDKYRMMQQYMFHLAVENECSDDYITEKVWGALSSGSLPIYFGAPNVNKHVPEHSVVNVADFSDWDELGEHLKYLTQNHTAYMEYHAWRDKPFSQRFLDTFYLTNTHSECRRCRWAYAKKHNLGWDHFRQEIVWQRGAEFESPKPLPPL